MGGGGDRSTREKENAAFIAIGRYGHARRALGTRDLGDTLQISSLHGPPTRSHRAQHHFE